MEMAVFYYAFASWRRKAFVPSNAFGFSYHKKNSYALVLYTIFRMTLVELIVIDLLIRVKCRTPPKGTRGYLRVAPGRPNVMIELRESLRARGPYGIEREVRTVGLALDDLAAFEKAYVLDATAL